jgi:hypothetical protein
MRSVSFLITASIFGGIVMVIALLSAVLTGSVRSLVVQRPAMTAN